MPALLLAAALSFSPPVQDRPRLETLAPPFDQRLEGEAARGFFEAGWPMMNTTVIEAYDGNRGVRVKVLFSPARGSEQARAELRAGVFGRVGRWTAEGGSCPAIAEAATAVAALPMLRLEPVTGADSPDPWRDLALDDLDYRLTAPAGWSGGAAAARVTANGGSASPLAPLALKALADLKGCWTPVALDARLP